MRSHANPRLLGGLTLALSMSALGAPLALSTLAAAEPRQAAGLLADPNALDKRESGSRAAPAAASSTPAQSPTTRTPKKPDPPSDSSFLAPPLPGYAVMFILAGAVIALNLWSSKRTNPD